MIIALTDFGDLGISMTFIYGLACYAVVGLIIAVAFVCFGVTRVLPERATVSTGARLLLLPGAAALWPYVLVRWLLGRRR